MVKGYKGQTCSEAIRASIQYGEVVSFKEFVRRVESRGSWKSHTVWMHFILLIVNLPPARLAWTRMEPFLFLRPDGQYELWDSAKHPSVKE